MSGLGCPAIPPTNHITWSTASTTTNTAVAVNASDHQMPTAAPGRKFKCSEDVLATVTDAAIRHPGINSTVQKACIATNALVSGSQPHPPHSPCRDGIATSIRRKLPNKPAIQTPAPTRMRLRF